MAELSEHEILFNTAALSALRRPQLVSLSKKYGLRANGKNQEMIQRLQDFGQTLTPSAKTAFDYGVNTRAQRNSTTPSVKMPELEMSDDDDLPADLRMVTALQSGASASTIKSPARESDAWEVLTSGDSSLIHEPDECGRFAGLGPKKSLPWKSALNGKPLENPTTSSKLHRNDSKSSSLKSLGSSLRRAASRSLSITRKHGAVLSASTNTKHSATTTSSTVPSSSKPPTILSPVRSHSPEQETENVGDQPMDEDDDPPSPASAIGVAKRHSSMSLHPVHRASTIRLVSPGPSALQELVRAVSPDPTLNDDDELPLTGLNSVDAIRKRASIQFPSGFNITDQRALNRRSMPILMSPQALQQTARITSAPSPGGLYPDLSKIRIADTPMRDTTTRAASLNLPGSFPVDPKPSPPKITSPTSPSSPSFVFGAGHGTSGDAFSSAGMKLLEEMQAKMGGTAFNPELLKGKRAEVNKLVATNTDLGSGPTGGWGLSSSERVTADRFAKAHERIFSQMSSIDSAGTARSVSASSKNVSASVPPGATPGIKRKLDGGSTDSNSGSLPRLVNGLPAARTVSASSQATDTKEEEAARSNKRTKTSVAPRYMSSIRGAVSKISASVGPGTPTSRSRRAEARSRFPFLANKKTTEAKGGSDAATSDSSKAPAKKTAGPQPPKRVSSLQSSTASIPAPSKLRTPSATTAACATSRAIASSTSSAESNQSAKSRVASASSRPPVTMVPMKDGSSGAAPSKRSISHPRPMSAASTSALSRSTPASSSGLPQPRKADALLSSRANASAPALNRSSLHTPTASSLARMQSTVKPPASVTPATPALSTPKRPLPYPPKGSAVTQSGVSITGIAPQIPTTSPFGAASSRANYLFESNFHFPAPGATVESPKRPLPMPPTVRYPVVSDFRSPTTGIKSPTAGLKSPSAMKSPTGIPRPRPMSTPQRVGKSPARPTISSAQRARARESGVASIKARGDSTVAQRRLEIRARHERMKQERELRAMLG